MRMGTMVAAMRWKPFQTVAPHVVTLGSVMLAQIISMTSQVGLMVASLVRPRVKYCCTAHVQHYTMCPDLLVVIRRVQGFLTR